MNRLPAPLTDPWFDAEFYFCARDTGSFRTQNEDGSTVTLAQAQGLWMGCPCCRNKTGNCPGHHILVPFANPRSGVPNPPAFGPVDRAGKHPRWQLAGGSGFADLTLTPSIDVGEPSCWHGYITNGVVRNA